MKVVALKTFFHDERRLRGDVFEASAELARALMQNKLVSVYEEPKAPVDEPAPADVVPSAAVESSDDDEPTLAVAGSGRPRRRRSKS